ncbi:MAG: hypothetical protein JW982_09440 [Spirochaetes bacterium]|nr:hypothetical protein [Spirochaetota bacterium]
MKMRKFRAHFFKIALFLIFLLTVSCKQKGIVQFCEGTDKDGKPVKCGSVFTSGDITLILESKDPFASEKLRVKIFNEDSGSAKPEETKFLEVEPSSKTARIDLSMYNPGNYRVTAENMDGKILTQGKVQIINDINP